LTCAAIYRKHGFRVNEKVEVILPRQQPHVGKEIARRRQDLGIKPTTLARHAGVEFETLRAAETGLFRGRPCKVRRSTLTAIEHALDQLARAKR
jgi:predicted transcriptional regulator